MAQVARVLKLQIGADPQVIEQRWRDSLRDCVGLKRAVLLIDKDGKTALSTTVWAHQAALTEFLNAPGRAQSTAKMRALLTAPSELVGQFELAAEISAE